MTEKKEKKTKAFVMVAFLIIQKRRRNEITSAARFYCKAKYFLLKILQSTFSKKRKTLPKVDGLTASANFSKV